MRRTESSWGRQLEGWDGGERRRTRIGRRRNDGKEPSWVEECETAWEIGLGLKVTWWLVVARRGRGWKLDGRAYEKGRQKRKGEARSALLF